MDKYKFLTDEQLWFIESLNDSNGVIARLVQDIREYKKEKEKEIVN